MRRRRAALDKNALDAAATALCARITKLDAYRDANRIAAYFAVNGEISLHPVIEHALAHGRQIFLPNLDQQALRFAPYIEGQKMRSNKFRLPEPDVGDDEMIAPENLDLVLLPLTVFDPARNRVGMGGGFYDRSFAFRQNPENKSPVLIGVAHDLQKVENLTPEPWDVRLDLVVTDAAIYS